MYLSVYGRSQWPRGLRHELPSLARTLGSNPTHGMDVCVSLICYLLYVGSGLATGWSPVQGVLPTVYRNKKLKKRPKSNKDCWAIDLMDWWITALQTFDSFFSFLIFYTIGRTPWTGDQPAARLLHAYMTAQTEWTHTDIHSSSGIRTHDPSAWAGENSSCLRPHDNCDQTLDNILSRITKHSMYLILVYSFQQRKKIISISIKSYQTTRISTA
jgi:hypothetical protein